DALGPRGESCARSAAEEAAPVLHWEAIGVAIKPPPPGSPSMVRYVTATTYQDVKSGKAVPTAVDSFTFGTGRYLAVLNVQARGGPIPQAVEQKLITAI